MENKSEIKIYNNISANISNLLYTSCAQIPADKRPVIEFDKYAWSRFKYVGDRVCSEFSCFGLSLKGDWTYIDDVIFIKQKNTVCETDLDMDAFAELIANYTNKNLRPEQFCRIWIHTHPGFSPQPSSTDWDTFSKVFGRCNWAAMLVFNPVHYENTATLYISNPGCYAPMYVKIPKEVEIVDTNELDLFINSCKQNTIFVGNNFIENDDNWVFKILCIGIMRELENKFCISFKNEEELYDKINQNEKLRIKFFKLTKDLFSLIENIKASSNDMGFYINADVNSHHINNIEDAILEILEQHSSVLFYVPEDVLYYVDANGRRLFYNVIKRSRKLVKILAYEFTKSGNN